MKRLGSEFSEAGQELQNKSELEPEQTVNNGIHRASILTKCMCVCNDTCVRERGHVCVSSCDCRLIIRTEPLMIDVFSRSHRA